jgi:hypothetical protein
MIKEQLSKGLLINVSIAEVITYRMNVRMAARIAIKNRTLVPFQFWHQLIATRRPR